MRKQKPKRRKTQQKNGNILMKCAGDGGILAVTQPIHTTETSKLCCSNSTRIFMNQTVTECASSDQPTSEMLCKRNG